MKVTWFVLLFVPAWALSYYECQDNVFQDLPCSLSVDVNDQNVSDPVVSHKGSDGVESDAVERINKEFKIFKSNKTEVEAKGITDAGRREIINKQISDKKINSVSSDDGWGWGWYFFIVCLGFYLLTYFSDKKKKRMPGVVKMPKAKPAYVKPLKTRTIYNVPSRLPDEFVIIDFETTGLNAEVDEIIQFGGLRIKNGVVVDELEFLVNTDVPIHHKAQAVHGISKGMLNKHGVTQVEAFRRINEFINDSQMMAYNAVFDAAFLDVGAVRHGYFFKRRMICLLRFSRSVWPYLSNHKLQTVVNMIGGGTQTHTALSDCYMAYSVYKEGVGRLYD